MTFTPPPKNMPKQPKNNAHNGAHTQNQPKPKFVAHKSPNQGKKEKAPKASNRLGGSHMA